MPHVPELCDDPVLLLPEVDEADPLVSIVVPALNEELTIADFLGWCHEGLARAGVRGEIVIVDSSTDHTPEIALDGGARVLRVPKRGLGQAYRDVIPFIRGRYVIMGDADCTYDFRELGPFLEALEAGNEFVMGSRFKGSIEAGAMPAHHRYFGTPITTAMLNILFSSRYSDIHCGMRAMTRDALVRMDLQAAGWEYASEMILKALHLGLTTTEVPISFYRDRNGRVSNVKRAGRLTSWKAGWDTLRVMFVNGADFFLYLPGVVLAVVGTIGVAVLATGPVTVGELTLTLHAESLFMAVALIGTFAVFMAIIARSLYDPTPQTALRYRSRLAFNRVAVVTIAMAALGFVVDSAFLLSYLGNDLAVDATLTGLSHGALAGLFLIVIAGIVFSSTLVVHAVAQAKCAASPAGTRTQPDGEPVAAHR